VGVVGRRVGSAARRRGHGRLCSTKTYGMDMLIEEDLSVWLIEVNRNPGGALCCDAWLRAEALQRRGQAGAV
jgi:hypothetical protein